LNIKTLSIQFKQSYKYHQKSFAANLHLCFITENIITTMKDTNYQCNAALKWFF
jgi:hypothetical protein